jgi:hypothetical protein
VRFPQETCSAIHDAYPHSAIIRWPAGAAEPQKGRVYRLQKDEEIKEREAKAKRQLEYSPKTCAQVMENMRATRTGRKAVKVGPKRHHRTNTGRSSGDALIEVLAVTILERGWEVSVVLHDDPDPILHTGLKTRVKGTAPKENQPVVLPVATETEPEMMLVPLSRREREEAEDAFKLEHHASIDEETLKDAEKVVKRQREQGKRSILAEQAVDRARRRVEMAPADRAISPV